MLVPPMPPLTLIRTEDTPSSVNIGAMLGAIYIGATIAAVFYGITILQTVIYYKQNLNDPWLFRYAIVLLWILDTLHVALSTHALYFYLIESFGRYPSLFTIIWSFPLQLLVNMLIIFGVQVCVTFGLLSDNQKDSGLRTTDYTPSEYGNAATFIRSFHGSFSVLTFYIQFVPVAILLGAGLYVIYDTYTLSSFVDISTIKVSIYTVFSTVAGADFIIAGVMCFYLHKGRSMTRFSRRVLDLVLYGLFESDGPFIARPR
ncbi:uncharacterized protein EV420DRAFT_1689898 [Desarmillaria tabescens]|uniref:Uncharacterized protein n=1 Tax=Armillaria tabescens TaxID=1929756 RepID=A0AA39K9X2_ARMTA|nr:uncharacterized protein EV420DRAFT_1689898 [Desarmillaria tabescens]KAK0457281.1 hypothetical protein EV420DRAFT_1689898 [Desarmillaria tabescens]